MDPMGNPSYNKTSALLGFFWGPPSLKHTYCVKIFRIPCGNIEKQPWFWRCIPYWLWWFSIFILVFRGVSNYSVICRISFWGGSSSTSSAKWPFHLVKSQVPTDFCSKKSSSRLESIWNVFKSIVVIVGIYSLIYSAQIFLWGWLPIWRFSKKKQISSKKLYQLQSCKLT